MLNSVTNLSFKYGDDPHYYFLPLNHTFFIEPNIASCGVRFFLRIHIVESVIRFCLSLEQ
jgi:hypothetical protein